MKELALARVRQLVAHEIGHTIGLQHNFISSADDRASVMDYPHPTISLNRNGDVEWRNAYDVGIGEWDQISVAYGYQDFPSNVDEDMALEEIIQNVENELEIDPKQLTLAALNLAIGFNSLLENGNEDWIRQSTQRNTRNDR